MPPLPPRPSRLRPAPRPGGGSGGRGPAPRRPRRTRPNSRHDPEAEPRERKAGLAGAGGGIAQVPPLPRYAPPPALSTANGERGRGGGGSVREGTEGLERWESLGRAVWAGFRGCRARFRGAGNFRVGVGFSPVTCFPVYTRSRRPALSFLTKTLWRMRRWLPSLGLRVQSHSLW
ncbi:translation initiation factor IF-2-like [Serinus canaria]|uniref:translation initiation factor IF-2-like n=1 Tax=Serinus canaria TaxID=9135 RepID=UPI0021CCBCE1|nr:translation initiation factor IF-2-like [Serinus canaria]